MEAVFNKIIAFLCPIIFIGGLTYLVVLPTWGWTKVAVTWNGGDFGYISTLPVASVKRLFLCLKMPMYGASFSLGFYGARIPEPVDKFWLATFTSCGAIVGLFLFVKYRRAGLFRPGQNLNPEPEAAASVIESDEDKPELIVHEPLDENKPVDEGGG